MNEPVVTGNGSDAANEFLRIHARVWKEHYKKQDSWIIFLRRELGAKAAHPDDGWVNRDKNIVSFAYPHFDDHPEVGDIIALGQYYEYRLVRVTEKIKRQWTLSEDDEFYYMFEEIDIEKPTTVEKKCFRLPKWLRRK